MIFSLGLILLLGFIAAKFIHRIKVPAVTAYLVLGIIIGPSALNLISKEMLNSSGLISNVVLGFIAFSIGRNFVKDNLRRVGRPVLWISIMGAVCPWLLVTFGLCIFLKLPVYVTLLFGAISSATAPAATAMVVREYKAKGSFTDVLLGVVAIDDAWCLVIFAVSLAASKALAAGITGNAIFISVLFHPLLEIFGSFLLGGVLSILLSYFSRYARTNEELLIYTLGFIFLAIGLSLYFQFSVLLSCMCLAALLVNVNKLSFKFFDVLKTIDSPFYLLFFVLVGANLDIKLLNTLGLLGFFYLIIRSISKIGGAYLGGCISRSSDSMKKYLGLSLLPQAGVALGVALIAKENFPQAGEIIFSTIVATTVVYELVGPVFTKFSLRKAGDIS
ncbi:MAG: cation:proton antiporter [Candidatus Omnitrophota bacterium]|nr:cation:proton antiporter [Candidatus Omnitrophota bacterium]